jgi:hypothetical protein
MKPCSLGVQWIIGELRQVSKKCMFQHYPINAVVCFGTKIINNHSKTSLYGKEDERPKKLT